MSCYNPEVEGKKELQPFTELRPKETGVSPCSDTSHASGITQTSNFQTSKSSGSF